MTMTEFGEGAVVQQSLIEANGDWHMERAVDHFKRLHPTRIDRLRVIVVDKDLNEIKVLESNFPDARVLIFHFLVIKYLKEKRAKPEYSKISPDDASQVDAAITAMVYADSADKYAISHDSFLEFVIELDCRISLLTSRRIGMNHRNAGCCTIDPSFRTSRTTPTTGWRTSLGSLKMLWVDL
jgi:hypothetical protein